MLSVSLRTATPADAEQIRIWRNDPVTRRFSLSPNPILPEEHAAWFSRTLADPRVRLLIASDSAARDIGVVRFARRLGSTHEIHVHLAPEARGQRLGSETIRAACRWVAEKHGSRRVLARVRSDNAASLRAFARAGFSPRRERAGLTFMILEQRPPCTSGHELPEGARSPLVLVNLRWDAAERLHDVVQRLPACSHLVLPSLRAPRGFDPGGSLLAALHVLGELLSARDCLRIDRFVLDLTRSWYLPGPGSPITARDPELEFFFGTLEYDLQYLLISRIRNLELTQRAIDRFRPDMVATIEDTGELHAAAALVAGARGLPIVRLEAPAPPKSRSRTRLSRSLLAPLRSWRDAVLDRLALRRLAGESQPERIILCSSHFDARLARTDALRCWRTIPFYFRRGFAAKLRALLRRRLYFPAAARWGSERADLPQKWQRLLDLYRPAERLYYGPYPLWGLVEEQVHKAFFSSFPEFLSCRATLQELHALKEVGAVLVRNDIVAREKAMVLAARELGIPTVHVQHGILAGRNGWDRIHSDFVAVWGKESVRWFEALGNHPARCVITGNPDYDRLQDFPGRHAEAARKLRRSVAPRGALLTLALSYVKKLAAERTDDEVQILLEELLAVMARLPEAHLIVKLHPRDPDASRHRYALSHSHPANVSVASHADLWTLILASDALLTVDSTAGLEAMILNRPVIVINLTGRPDLVPYVERGAAIGVYRPDDILPTLQRIVADRSIGEQLRLRQQDFVREFAHAVDGQATERLGASLREVAQSRARSAARPNPGSHERARAV